MTALHDEAMRAIRLLKRRAADLGILGIELHDHVRTIEDVIEEYEKAHGQATSIIEELQEREREAGESVLRDTPAG